MIEHRHVAGYRRRAITAERRTDATAPPFLQSVAVASLRVSLSTGPCELQKTPDAEMPVNKSPTVESRQELVEYLASGCKPAEQWKLGTEHEKFGYTLDDLRPLPYEGERGIRAVLTALAEQFGWNPVLEDGRIIALSDETGPSRCGARWSSKGSISRTCPACRCSRM